MIAFLFRTIQHLEEFPVHADVIRELRMKRRRHDLALSYQDRIVAFAR